MKRKVNEDAWLKELALLLAVNCVRNTVIEDYHAEGKLSDPEMMAFNREVSDKLYTALRYLMPSGETEEDRKAFLRLLMFMRPHDWDEPKLDADFLEGLETFKGGEFDD